MGAFQAMTNTALFDLDASDTPAEFLDEEEEREPKESESQSEDTGASCSQPPESQSRDTSPLDEGRQLPASESSSRAELPTPRRASRAQAGRVGQQGRRLASVGSSEPPRLTARDKRTRAG